MEFTNRSC